MLLQINQWEPEQDLLPFFEKSWHECVVIAVDWRQKHKNQPIQVEITVKFTRGNYLGKRATVITRVDSVLVLELWRSIGLPTTAPLSIDPEDAIKQPVLAEVATGSWDTSPEICGFSSMAAYLNGISTGTPGVHEETQAGKRALRQRSP